MSDKALKASTKCEYVKKDKSICSQGRDGKPAACDPEYVSCNNAALSIDTYVMNCAVGCFQLWRAIVRADASERAHVANERCCRFVCAYGA